MLRLRTSSHNCFQCNVSCRFLSKRKTQNMKVIIKYAANDNSEWQTEAEALKRDALLLEVESIMCKLKPKPIKDEGCKFANGYYFIQQDSVIVKKVRFDFLELVKKYINHKWVEQTQNGEDIHPSWVSRLLGDYGIDPLCNAWYRLSNIDKQFREWGQGYFVEHPNESPALKGLS